jgi:hypothetical protein
METRLRLDDRGSIRGRVNIGIFSLFVTASRQALRPTQPPMQLVPRSRSPEVNWPGRETDNSFPYSAEGKNAWSYTSTSH